MAGIGKPSIVRPRPLSLLGALGAPNTAMAQIPFPMIPNFGFGPQHYRSGSSHYSTRSHSRHEEEKETPVDKSKEKDATQPDSTASASAQQRQQLSGPPRDAASHDAAPPAGPSTPASPPPAQKTNDDQPAFQPSR